jgi:hypothetical protein
VACRKESITAMTALALVYGRTRPRLSSQAKPSSRLEWASLVEQVSPRAA